MITIATGREALTWHEAHGLGTLCKHADPIEGAREGLDLDEAHRIHQENHQLIYLTIDPAEVRRIVVGWEDDSDAWWEAFDRAIDERAYPRKLHLLRDEMEALNGNGSAPGPSVILPRRWAAELLAWAATLPGWSDGDERPLSCQAVS